MSEQTPAPFRYTPDGGVNTEWLNSLDVAQCEKWLAEVLMCRDIQLPDNRDEGHFFLVDCHRHADDSAQEKIRIACHALLCEMDDDTTSEWRIDRKAGNRLLWLVGEVFTGCHGNLCAYVKATVFSLAEIALLYMPGLPVDEDLHGRLLQLHNTLGIPKPLSFWRAQVSRDPAAYIGVALRGAPNHTDELLAMCPDDMPDATHWEINTVLEINEILREQEMTND